MRSVYENDLHDMGMDKYFSLDLDADMMKKDLEEMGITVNAKYFNAKEVQAKVSESARK